MLEATSHPGHEGVTRWTFRDLAGHVVGNARTMGGTIGDIEVNPRYRRLGYGTEIVRYLISKGGRFAYPGSEAGARTMKRAGMRLQGGRFVV